MALCPLHLRGKSFRVQLLRASNFINVNKMPSSSQSHFKHQSARDRKLLSSSNVIWVSSRCHLLHLLHINVHICTLLENIMVYTESFLLVLQQTVDPVKPWCSKQVERSLCNTKPLQFYFIYGCTNWISYVLQSLQSAHQFGVTVAWCNDVVSWTLFKARCCSSTQ